MLLVKEYQEAASLSSKSKSDRAASSSGSSSSGNSVGSFMNDMLGPTGVENLEHRESTRRLDERASNGLVIDAN